MFPSTPCFTFTLLHAFTHTQSNLHISFDLRLHSIPAEFYSVSFRLMENFILQMWEWPKTLSILLHRLHLFFRPSILLSLRRVFRPGTKFCYALTSIDSQSECITELRPGTQNIQCQISGGGRKCTWINHPSFSGKIPVWYRLNHHVWKKHSDTEINIFPSLKENIVMSESQYQSWVSTDILPHYKLPQTNSPSYRSHFCNILYTLIWKLILSQTIMQKKMLRSILKCHKIVQQIKKMCFYW